MIRTVALTDVGPRREHNEDAVYAGTVDDRTLLVVADGMGGHRAGDIASEEAIDTFVSTVESSSGPAEQILEEGVENANDRLQKMAAEDPELDGMGTTLVAALVADGSATLVNIGDSRAYHATDEGLAQVTTDQSLVQQLVEQGTISPEEADDHPQSNVLTQSLGTDETIEPDVYTLALDGTLLLCSDGLSDDVPESEIYSIISSRGTLEDRGQQLIERANELDGSDNVSVVLGET